VDMVDCKNLLCGINLWLAVAAAGLAIPVWLRLINPGLILVWVFLMGIGFAFNAPASISIVPEIVSDAELPAATTLSGLQLNIAGIVGPPLGGLLVQLLGASFVFLVNAACFLFVIIAIRQFSQGAMALGGVIWGCTASKVGLSFTLLGAAFLFLISLALAIPLSINSTGALGFNPAQMTNPISRPKTSSRLPVATKD
jgi:MFS family permease